MKLKPTDGWDSRWSNYVQNIRLWGVLNFYTATGIFINWNWQLYETNAKGRYELDEHLWDIWSTKVNRKQSFNEDKCAFNVLNWSNDTMSYGCFFQVLSMKKRPYWWRIVEPRLILKFKYIHIVARSKWIKLILQLYRLVW